MPLCFLFQMDVSCVHSRGANVGATCGRPRADNIRPYEAHITLFNKPESALWHFTKLK